MDIIEYEDVKFQGNINAKNAWKGNPSPELDRAWQDIVVLNHVKVEPGAMLKLQKPLEYARFPKEADPKESYIGEIEVFHQVCTT